MPRSITLLVVDDDEAVRNACEAIAETMGITSISAASAREGLEVMARTPVDVALTDLRMPGMNGMEFLKELRNSNPEVFVIVMSGYGSIENAVEAMKLGAYDFLSKPFELNELREVLGGIERQLALNSEATLLRQELAKQSEFSSLSGRSPEMQQVYRVVLRAAKSSSPMLLLGEPGTGKEMLARSIHLATQDIKLSFIPVDCASVMPELLESELFGYVKGSFPGASMDLNNQGLLANAECGTVFLDEVTGLSLEVQAKLARALEQKEVHPRGSTRMAPLKARVMASSSRDLAKLVAMGKFRQDLYYRLSVFVVRLPALRDRREDIPQIVEQLLRKISNQYRSEKSISAEALRALAALDLPGNMTELEAVVERAYTLTAGTSISLSDIRSATGIHASVQPVEDVSATLSLAETERISVLRAIETCGGDKGKVARLLGIGRSTLYRKLHEYKLTGAVRASADSPAASWGDGDLP